jgi:hypothetical protein
MALSASILNLLESFFLAQHYVAECRAKNVMMGLFCAIIRKLKMAMPFLVLKFLVLKPLAGFGF